MSKSEQPRIVRMATMTSLLINCAPTGYYGPEWFSGDVFIGAGPWFHGSADFSGKVNNRLHPEHGYKGALPARGEKAEPVKRVDSSHFKGNEARDGRGHVTKAKNSGSGTPVGTRRSKQ